MKAIWKVEYEGKTHWFETRKEVKAFCIGAGLEPETKIKIDRIPIGGYLNPSQLITFIKENFNA